MIDSTLLLTAGGRAFTLLGLLVIVGAAACSWIAPARAIRGPMLGAGLMLLLAVSMQTLGQLMAFDAFAADAGPLSETVGMFASTNWGRSRAALAAMSLLILGGSLLPARALNSTSRVLSVLLVLLIPWLGHAASSEHQLLAFALTVVHAAAAALWLGTLALLGPPWWHDVQALHPIVSRYGRLALVSAPLVVISGAVTVWTRLDSPWQLLEPGYGRLVLMKTGVVLCILALGARHHLRMVRTQHENGPSMRRSLQLELLLMLGVLALTGWLGESEPPTLG